MRQPHCTITPSVVRSVAGQALQRALPWRAYGRLVTVARLLGLLLLAAALRRSLSAVARRFRFGFSHETARKAVAANLPADLNRLTGGLVDALHAFAGPRWRQRRWDVAMDLHYCPFYGDKHAPGVVGGQKKSGSQRFYAYATAVLLYRGRRYTVGLLPVTGKAKPHQVVEALLGQIAARGLRLRGVVLDSGFDSGETLLLLQAKDLAYAVPLRRKGAGHNRRNAAFALPAGTVTTVDWVTEKSRRPVRTEAVVVLREGEDRPRVYAFGGWGAGTAASRAQQAARKYRARFGIETSYRQLNEGKARTTKKDAAYRLLLVGLALLLRQAWVWLAAQVARARGLGPDAWVDELPLARLLDWLADALKRTYPERQAIELPQPLIDFGAGSP
ncbi:MAG TPA: transposase [Vicinamibacteria bacterium]|nr:transposase [Vicinamibacteria bacterium]